MLYEYFVYFDGIWILLSLALHVELNIVALAKLLFFPLCFLMSFLSCAFVRKNGISFVSIDESLPLSEQGPFDVILHKVSHILF